MEANAVVGYVCIAVGGFLAIIAIILIFYYVSQKKRLKTYLPEPKHRLRNLLKNYHVESQGFSRMDKRPKPTSKSKGEVKLTAEHKHYIERYHSARATANTVRVPVQRHITTQQPITERVATSRVVQRPIATRVLQQKPMSQQIILDPQNLTKQKVHNNMHANYQRSAYATRVTPQMNVLSTQTHRSPNQQRRASPNNNKRQTVPYTSGRSRDHTVLVYGTAPRRRHNENHVYSNPERDRRRHQQRNHVKRNRSHNDVVMYQVVTPRTGRKRLMLGRKSDNVFHIRQRQQQKEQMNQVSHWVRQHSQTAKDKLVTLEMLRQQQEHNLSVSTDSPRGHNVSGNTYNQVPLIAVHPPAPQITTATNPSPGTQVLASSTLKRDHPDVYRQLDSSHAYSNEEEIGAAISPSTHYPTPYSVLAPGSGPGSRESHEVAIYVRDTPPTRRRTMTQPNITSHSLPRTTHGYGIINLGYQSYDRRTNDGHRF